MLLLEEIINGVMSQHELPDSSFARLSNIGIRGYRMLHYHSIGTPKTIPIEVLGNKTAYMPCDLLTVLALGPLNGKGEIVSLTEDSMLGLGDSTSAKRTTQKTDDVIFTEEDYIFSNPISSLTYPGFFQAQYGTGSRSDLGFYRLDWKSRTIIFDFGFQGVDNKICYLPIAGNDDGDYFVHPLFQEALIGFITWQHMVGNRKYNANDRAEAKQYYDNQLRIARRAKNPFSPQDVYNAYYQTTRMARF